VVLGGSCLGEVWIPNGDVHEDKYGFNGQVIFKMRHNQKLFQVSSIHLDQNRLLKNVGIEFKIFVLKRK